MQDQAKRQEQDSKILHRAKEWRRHDRIAVKNKTDREKLRAEYHARQQLRDAIDKAET